MKVFIGLLRIAVGFVFFWAFIDKTFGFGFSTTSERAWIAGGSPTYGYLTNATHGPFASFFHSLAGNPLVDWLFMLGLLGVGVGLLLGIALRITVVSGLAMLTLMYLSAFPPSTNPFLDEHIIYMLVLIVLLSQKSGDILGFGKNWQKSGLVKNFKFLSN